MDELSFVASLDGILSGHFKNVQVCPQFYSTNKNLEIHELWLPSKYKKSQVYDLFIPNIDDDKLRGLVNLFQIECQKLDELNARWTTALSSYFDVPLPQSKEEIDSFAYFINKHRLEKGPTWMNEPACQQLLAEMQPIVAEIEQLKLQIDQEMSRVYGHIMITDEDFGDQRAKDLVDLAFGIPDSNPKKAIKLLQKALSYGETGIQASKAFVVLGMRYEYLGEIDLAIENYSKAMEAYHPGGMLYFWRGKLYYQQQKWEDAKNDFEKALSFSPEEGHVPSPEKEAAEQYLLELSQYFS